jgi:hypothetical protein
MAQPNNTNPVPVEERLGLEAGVLLLVGKKAAKLNGYPLSALDPGKRDPNPWVDLRQHLASRVPILPGDYLVYVRREADEEGSSKGIWVVFSPKLEKNLAVFNRALWKSVEVVSRPDKP